MKPLIEIIRELKSQSWVKYSGFDRIGDYVSNGGAAVLRAIPSPGRIYYWVPELTEAFHDPVEWTDEDRRLLHVLGQMDQLKPFWEWLDPLLERETENQDFFGAAIRELPGISQPELVGSAVSHMRNCEIMGRPTSYGRYLLEMNESAIEQAIGAATFSFTAPGFVSLLMTHVPELADRLLPHVLERMIQRTSFRADVFAVLLQKNGKRYESLVVERTNAEKDTSCQFWEMQSLFGYAPKRHRAMAISVMRRVLAEDAGKVDLTLAADWTAENLGADGIPLLTTFVDRATREYEVASMARIVRERYGAAAMPIFEGLLNNEHGEVQAVGIESVMQLDDTDRASIIEAQLRKGLKAKRPEDVLRILKLVQKWKPTQIADALWKLLEHKSNPVRNASVRLLASLGSSAEPQAISLLTHKKADTRVAATSLLAALGSKKALAAIEDRLNEEETDDVRDQMLLSLEDAWIKQGREVTRKDIAARIARTEKKLGAVAGWIKERKLPPLKWSDGKSLTKLEVSYLLYRQSRSKEMRADPEAAAVYKLLDRAGSAPFAEAVLDDYFRSVEAPADRWIMALAGLLGDDRIVPLLVTKIHYWVNCNRGKMAEYAVQALALLGTDAALLAVDTLAIRYRSKMKNVGRAATEAFAEAAERLGLTPDELGDRVVPWLCFSPGEPCVIEAGEKRFEARIGMDYKMHYVDLQKNKSVKSLPKSVLADVAQEMKEAAAQLREVVKAQTLRLENLLVRQRRWPASQWRELFLLHPVMLPFATRLVWGAYDGDGGLRGLFRVLEDRTLTTEKDEAYELPKKTQVGMIHPLELDEAIRKEWTEHLADYEVEPPFPQMERVVVLVGDDERDRKCYRELDGHKINGMTFKGRAERLGWVRGSVADAGCVTSYHKSFPAAGVDVLIGIEDMFMGMDMYDEIRLGPVFFVRDGAVKYGSYVYDDPNDENDERMLRYADVPPIAFSEAMGNLKRIAFGKASQANEEE